MEQRKASGRPGAFACDDAAVAVDVRTQIEIGRARPERRFR